MFTGVVAKCRGSSPGSFGCLQLCLQMQGQPPLGALDAYNYVRKIQGQLPFELCWFTARFAKLRGSSPELWMFIAMLAKCRGSSPWSLGRVYSYVCKMQGQLPWEHWMCTAMFAKCRGSSPGSIGCVQLCLQNAGAFPLGALYIYS